jgi:hypothetical protein
MNNGSFALAALAAGLLASMHAEAQTPEIRFRGTYVCGRLPTTHDILVTPFDLIVRGRTVQFARPLFNPDGTRVVGSELGAGMIDADGALHLKSEWSYRGNIAQADYSGALTPEGGTLIGTQVWSGQDGAAPISRTCTAALVPAPRSTEGPRRKGPG